MLKTRRSRRMAAARPRGRRAARPPRCTHHRVRATVPCCARAAAAARPRGLRAARLPRYSCPPYTSDGGPPPCEYSGGGATQRVATSALGAVHLAPGTADGDPSTPGPVPSTAAATRRLRPPRRRTSRKLGRGQLDHRARTVRILSSRARWRISTRARERSLAPPANSRPSR